ncbi:hypothetical protein [Okeania sp. SIO2B3]|uniref:hypothetical protein n=1 Tax=Okeania sp. SIO2B3 TaxID=2607784 RepID=UPI0013C15BE0|nr:hypothetical protein [Okeania sp. SIO2B3]NET45760.1 hypothetical protein [Okeania sp. SIO2B3]
MTVFEVVVEKKWGMGRWGDGEMGSWGVENPPLTPPRRGISRKIWQWRIGWNIF